MTSRRPIVAVVLLLVAGAALCAALDDGPLLALGLALAAVLAGAGRVAERGFEPDADPRGGPGHALALFAVLALAAGLRLWELANYPRALDYDCVQNGWIGLELLDRLPSYEPVLTEFASGNETAFIYLLGFSLRLLGHSIEALRLPAALVGTATVAAVYLLGRVLFNRSLGLVAAFLVALAPWHVELSRMAKQPVLVPLVVALGLLALARMLEAREPARAWRGSLLCGLAAGAGLHSYEAARAFPLAIACALLWVRARQGCARRGLAELGATALVATLVASPILWYAARHPELYMAHAGINSIFHDVRSAGSLAPLGRNVLATTGHLLLRLPGGSPASPAAAIGVVAPLFLVGLAGLLLRGPAAPGRPLLGLTLLWMALPFMLARFHIDAPRRYTGVLVPFYLLAAAPLVGLLRATAARLGPRIAGGLAAMAGAAALALIPSIFSMLNRWAVEKGDPFDQQVLRWSHAQSAARDVYLEPTLVRGGYLARFFLRRPGLHELESVWPLPDGPLERDLLLVARDAPWWPALGALFDARRRTVRLPSPPGRRPFEIVVYALPREALRARRLSPAQLARGARGLLLVTRPGQYAFRPPPGASAALQVGDTRARIEAGDRPLELLLAAGLHPLAYKPDEPGDLLQWRPPGAAVWQPLPAGRCWRLPPNSLPPAPPARSIETSFLIPVIEHVPADEAYAYNRALQDIEIAPDGGYFLLDLDRHPVKRWNPGRPVRPEPVLRRSDGSPYTYRQRYAADRAKQLSLAASAAGLYLLDRRAHAITRFGPDGRERGRLSGPFVAPFDLAAAGRTVYVADPGQRAILACPADGSGPARPIVREIHPLAVAARGGRLAYLDLDDYTLVLCELPAARVLHRIQLGAADRRMRLALAADGRIVLSDWRRRQVLLFGDDGSLLFPRGDRYLSRMEDPPCGAVLLSEGRQLAVLGSERVVLALSEMIGPDQRPGLTLQGTAFAEGNLGRPPIAQFGGELATDGGRHPAYAVWRFRIRPGHEGRQEIWALYATGEERPLTLLVDGRVAGEELSQRTGGFHQRDLRWQLMGQVRLDAGEHTLRLQSRGYFPHLSRLRLVRR